MQFLPESLDAPYLWRLLENHSAGFLVTDAEGKLVHCNPAALSLLNLQRLEGQSLTELLGSLGEVSTDVCYQKKILRVRPMSASGDWHWWVAFDVTDEQLALRRNAALVKLASNLTYADTMQATLDGLAASVLNASSASGIAVVMLEEEERLQALGTAGLPAAYRDHLVYMFENNQLPEDIRANFRARRPHTEPDRRRQLLTDPRWQPVHHYLAEAPWNSLALYPMVIGSHNLGFVGSYYAELELSPHKLAFSQAVADLCAVAAENIRLFQQSQQHAVLLDRQRIARELHDSVSQALYGIALGAETALVHLQNQRYQPLKETLDYIAGLDRVAQAEMRSLIFELRPETMDSEGLVGLIQRQLLTLEVRYKITVTSILFEPDLSPSAKHQVYRIIQEAIHNIAKHARASQVSINMREDSGQLRITLTDDGQGMTLPGHRPGHIGLQSMQERAHQINAHIDWQSAPGQGTTLTLSLPL